MHALLTLHRCTVLHLHLQSDNTSDCRIQRCDCWQLTHRGLMMEEEMCIYVFCFWSFFGWINVLTLKAKPFSPVFFLECYTDGWQQYITWVFNTSLYINKSVIHDTLFIHSASFCHYNISRGSCNCGTWCCWKIFIAHASLGYPTIYRILFLASFSNM